MISIAAGYAIADLQAGLGDEARIVRSMPNTPAMVGEGMSGVSYDENLFTDEEKQVIDGFFTSFGKMEKVDEKLMDVVEAPAAVHRHMYTCSSRRWLTAA